MESNEYVEYLLSKYLRGNISKEEQAILFEYLSENKYDEILSNRIITDFNSTTTKRINDLDINESKIILNTILNSSKTNSFTGIRNFNRLAVIAVSAAAILTLFFFVWLSFNKYNSLDSQFSSEIVEKQFVEYVNNTDSVQRLTLSDFSTIDVYPKSSIHYPENFKAPERIVYLKGKAFFTISKDSILPFIVYSDNLQTRVLGTSFLIHSDSVNGIEEVEVRTGKVQIIENISHNDSKHINKSLVLMPNQKGVYDARIGQLHKTLVTIPKPILDNGQDKFLSMDPNNFNYEQTSLVKVFKDLETSYGVNFVLENSLLANCTFTGSLTDINLFTKLQILCLTTQSTYEVVGTDIIIKGKGCK